MTAVIDGRFREGGLKGRPTVRAVLASERVLNIAQSELQWRIRLGAAKSVVCLLILRT